MKLALYFFIFFFSHSIVQSYMYWVTKNSHTLTVFNFQLSSVWTCWFLSLLVATPILSIANYAFGATFYFGYESYKSAWLIFLSYVAAQTVTVPVMIWVWFGEIPTKGPLVGVIFALLGLLIANDLSHIVS
ncbi:MAG: hypothetical protein HYS98_07050 [Deltaproteobacteria bacterium]|nr:hypothetical protein [Deltaproteobacteria bacterium]